MHTEQAIDAIDYNYYPDVKSTYAKQLNGISDLATCPYFSTNLLYFDKFMKRDYSSIDSFIVLMCMQGSATLKYEHGEVTIAKGETVLLPAAIKHIELIPAKTSKLLESFVP